MCDANSRWDIKKKNIKSDGEDEERKLCEYSQQYIVEVMLYSMCSAVDISWQRKKGSKMKKYEKQFICNISTLETPMYFHLKEKTW